MTSHPCPASNRHNHLNLWAAALLFVCVMFLIMGLVLVLRDGSTPLILIPATLTGAAAIACLRS